MTATFLRTGVRLAGLVWLVGLLGGCGDDAAVAPRSLASPSGLATARSCIASVDGVEVRAEPARCESGELQGSVQTVGLVANRERRSLMMLAMDGTFPALFGEPRSTPALFDADRSVPGVTGLAVCDGPSRLVTTPDGNFAVVLCDLAEAVSVVAVPRLEEVLRVNRHAIEVDMAAAPDAPLLAFARPEAAVVRVERLAYDCGGATDVFPSDCDPAVALELVADLATPGRPSSVAALPGGRFWVAYQDLPYVSRFDLEPGEGVACLDEAASAPCETQRVGLTAECRDGLDNDGDGGIDTDDAQCFDAGGAESPDSPRGRLTACTDGVDNDGDGLVDNGDTGCLLAADDDEGEAFRAPACSNGVDDDGDEAIDGEDADCVAAVWGDESRAPECANGVDDDEDGDTDGDDSACLDPLWDDEATEPALEGAACDNGFDDDGDGWVDERDSGCDDPSDEDEGAAAPVCADGADNDGDGLTDLDDPDCYGPAGRSERAPDAIGFGPLGLDEDLQFLFVSDSREHQVLVVDLATGALLDAGVDDILHPRRGVAVTSAGVVARSLSYAVEFSDDETFPGQTATTRVTFGIVPVSDGVARVLDLRRRFTLAAGGSSVEEEVAPLRPRDNDPQPAEVGDEDCEIPVEYRELVRLARGDVGQTRVICEDVEVPRLGALDDAGTRVQLVTEPAVQVVEGALNVQEVTSDWRLRDETWTLEWEGVLPGTERSDGLIDADRDGRLVSAGADFCGLGVEPGDRLAVDAVTPALGVPAETCAEFLAGTLEYRVAFVRADALYLEPVGEAGFVTRLPNRDCFATGFTYRVRVPEQWTVVGSQSGFLHDGGSALEQCLRLTGDERRAGRARFGELFENPFFSFRIDAGTVAPTRGTLLVFGVENRFAITNLETGPLPVDIDLTDTAAGRRLWISDGGVNVVFVFDAGSLLPLTEIF